MWNLPAVDCDAFQSAGLTVLHEASVHEPLSVPAIHRKNVRAHSVLFVPGKWDGYLIVKLTKFLVDLLFSWLIQ